MQGRDIYLWQVRSFTVRVDLALVDNLNQRLADTRLNPGDEIGGILLGRKLADNEIEISDFEFVTSKHHRGATYNLGLREQLNFAKKVAGLNRRTRLKPIGFFRSHHRKGLFLDQDDFSLMTEAFADPSDIALLIRPVKPGPSNAGIFLWNNGDIDRRQTPLLFPFDGETLRTQGPVELLAQPQPGFIDTESPRAVLIPAVTTRSIAWGLAACAGAIALSAAFPHIHVRQSQPVPIATTASPIPKLIVPSEPELPQIDPAPADFVAPKPDEGQVLQPASRLAPKPFVEPKAFQLRAAPKQIPAIAPPPVVLPQPVAIAAVPIPPADFPVRQPASTTLRHGVRNAGVHVAIDIETKQSSELRRVMSHVPLLGRTVHAEGGNTFSPARPNGTLEPRVPGSLASNLTENVAVDVRLSINKTGAVTNTEVLHGAASQLASLAATDAGGASWEPAREGDHRVASDVIVHYRFSRATGAQP